MGIIIFQSYTNMSTESLTKIKVDVNMAASYLKVLLIINFFQLNLKEISSMIYENFSFEQKIINSVLASMFGFQKNKE